MYFRELWLICRGWRSNARQSYQKPHSAAVRLWCCTGCGWRFSKLLKVQCVCVKSSWLLYHLPLCALGVSAWGLMWTQRKLQQSSHLYCMHTNIGLIPRPPQGFTSWLQIFKKVGRPGRFCSWSRWVYMYMYCTMYGLVNLRFRYPWITLLWQ